MTSLLQCLTPWVGLAETSGSCEMPVLGAEGDLPKMRAVRPQARGRASGAERTIDARVLI